MAKRRLGIFLVFFVFGAIAIVCGHGLGSGEERGREDGSKLAHGRITAGDRNRNGSEETHAHEYNGDPEHTRCHTRHDHVVAIDASSTGDDRIPVCTKLLNSPHILRPFATTTTGPTSIVTPDFEAQKPTSAPNSDEDTDTDTDRTSIPGWVIVQTITLNIQPTNGNFRSHTHTRMKEFAAHTGTVAVQHNPSQCSCSSLSSNSSCTSARNAKTGGRDSKYRKAQVRREVVLGCIIGSFMGCLVLGLAGALCWGWVRGRRRRRKEERIVEEGVKDASIASSP